MISVGTHFQLTIDRLSLGGDGVGRWNELVVFVPYSAIGDQLEVEVIESKPRYLRALPKKILQASVDRTTPPCPYHFNSISPTLSSGVCGGCSWQHINYARQLEQKRILVQETFQRIGKLPQAKVLPTFGMQTPWRYRNKVQQPVGWDGKKIVSGFFAPESHTLVPIDDCLLESELSVAIINRAKTLLEEVGTRVYDEDRHHGWLRHLFVRVARGKAMLVLITRTAEFPGRDRVIQTLLREFPGLLGIHQNVNPARTNVILGREWICLAGEEFLEERIGDIRYALSPASFFQVNTTQAEVLYQEVKKRVGKGPLLVDVYSGVGSIALFLASQFQQVIGIENNSFAVQNAKENAKRNNIRHAHFLDVPAEKGFHQIRDELYGKPFVVVVDPPRAGCALSVLQSIIQSRAQKIIYVSCDPGTLARDAAILVQGGYRFVEAQPVDMFPHTPHIETVAEFTRL